jgi:putative transposase
MYCIFVIEEKRRENTDKEWISYTRRWVVERTNSWHNRFRKLLIRYEKKSENYLAQVCLACCIIVYRGIILG